MAPKTKCLCGEHSSQRKHFEAELENIERLIVLNKIRYYYPGKLDNQEPVDDRNYDGFEERYLQLCYLLNKPNELVHKSYGKMIKPGTDEIMDVPEYLDGVGMLEIDFEHPTVLKYLPKKIISDIIK